MESSEAPILHNFGEWIHENTERFLPPVCNKMMHDAGQMKAMFVGGPNQRKDYHIELGEELFYQRRGDMTLKVVANNQHRDVHIREGQLFLLPCRVAHSPQRQADTLGLVIERERRQGDENGEGEELDGLRYYVEVDDEPTLESLYEDWFYCKDLGSELPPLIARFRASDQFLTGQPLPGTIPDPPPVILDAERQLQDPIYLREWIDANRAEIDEGRKLVFEGNYQFQVFVHGAGDVTDSCAQAETLIWQLDGGSIVTVDGEKFTLGEDDSLLVPTNHIFRVVQPAGSLALVCNQDPTRMRRN